MFVTCGKLSCLYVSFLLHIKYTVSYIVHIVKCYAQSQQLQVSRLMREEMDWQCQGRPHGIEKGGSIFEAAKRQSGTHSSSRFGGRCTGLPSLFRHSLICQIR